MNKVKYVETLPTMNLSEDFIILENSFSSFIYDWLEFQDVFISTFKKDLTDKKLQSIKRYKKGSMNFFDLNYPATELLGLSESFDLLDIHYESGIYKYINKMNYNELINDFYFSNEKIKLKTGYLVRSILDKFFIFQWSNKKLLFPIGMIQKGFQRKKGWDDFVLNKNEFIGSISARVLNKNASITATKTRYSLISYIVTATSWVNNNQVSEDSLVILKDYLHKYFKDNKRKRDSVTLCINEIRYMLIDKGRDDIRHPKEIQKENKYKSMKYISTDSLISWLDETQYPSFKVLKKELENYKNDLKKVDGLYDSAIRSQLSSINHLFKYLFEFFSHTSINEDVVNYMYNLNSKNSIHKYLQENQKLKISRYEGVLKDIGRFLEYIGLYTNFAKKNTPRIKRKKVTSPRDAMPKEMLLYLIDIVKNRPPKKDVYWNKNKADLSWWKHENVYPVFPLMSLLHYHIPLRGAQIRNLCRDISFKIDPIGQEVSSIVVNTDKNVNRETLQEIPCIWEDLQIFKDFIKWHKEYFPFLPKVKYQDEENSPFPEFTPLMIVEGSNKPMDQKTYFNYHKRVLCQYQIEMQNKYINKEIDVLPQVAWMRKSKKSFFKTIEELESTSDNYLNLNVDIAYDVHSLRVTGITRYLDAGLGIHLISLLSGHSDMNTLIRVYVKLSREEQLEKLKSSVKKLFMGEKTEFISSCREFIYGELASQFTNSKKNDENLNIAFNENGLFSLHRKDESAGKSHEQFKLGTEIAKTKHPSLWQIHIFGICPGVLCESGRERRCSLCPYLITGKLFIHGIAHQTNLTFARFYRLSKEIFEEKKLSRYSSHAKAQELEIIMEEILGWHEIMKKVEGDLIESNAKLPIKTSKSEIFEYKIQDELISYLENAYDARAFGVEQDTFGLKVLTIKASQIVYQEGLSSRNLSFLNNEEESLDFLLSYFTKKDNYRLLPEINKIVS